MQGGALNANKLKKNKRHLSKGLKEKERTLLLSIPDYGHSHCKGPEAPVCLECLRIPCGWRRVRKEESQKERKPEKAEGDRVRSCRALADFVGMLT